MSTNIRNLVEQQVPTAYRGQARPVVDNVVRAIEQERNAIAGRLLSAARNAGVSEGDAREAFYSAGLLDRPTPPPAAAPAASTSGNGVVERLVAFAKRHGFEG